MPIDDVRRKKKGSKPLLALSNHRKLACHKPGQTFVSLSSGFCDVRWIANESIQKRDPEFCKNGCETLFLGNLWCRQPISKKTNTLCVAIGMFVLGNMGNNSPVFFSWNRSIAYPFKTDTCFRWSHYITESMEIQDIKHFLCSCDMISPY